jgi:CheY-like chemotaxis protein
MKVLLIEDDNFKEKSLTDFMASIVTNLEIKCAPSLVDAIEAIDNNIYDLILIDMAIPSHPILMGGGAPISLLTGGIEVLLELSSLERTDPCIIITQYPDIEISSSFVHVSHAANEIKSRLNCEVLDCILYSEDSGDWKIQLNHIVEKL